LPFALRLKKFWVNAALVGPDSKAPMAIPSGATAGQLATTPHYHPTLSEIWTYPAEELAEA